MKGYVSQAFAKAMLCVIASTLLCACAPQGGSSGGVAAAYETSGLLNTGPYTRTIFSSENF